MHAALLPRHPGVSLLLLTATLACSAAGQDSADAGAEPVAADARCEFEDTYSFARVGGMALYYDSYVLEPPARFTMTRKSTFPDRAGGECSGELPACAAPDSGNQFSVAAVMEHLSDEAVLDAWPDSGEAKFGADHRPMDGSMLAVTRGRGGTLLIGPDCRGGSGCSPRPPEIDSLGRVLDALARQISAAPECADLRG